MRLRATKLTAVSPGRAASPTVPPTPPSNLWTPASISTALWLDAADASTITLNGSTVSQWNDKSGNGFNVSQATVSLQPTYEATGLNGKPTINNVIVNRNLNRTIATSLGNNVGQLSMCLVVEYAIDAAFLSNASELFVSSGTSAAATRVALSPNTGSPVGNQGVCGRRLDTDGFVGAATSTVSDTLRGSPFFKVGQADYQNAQANHWTNGTQDLTAGVFQTAGNTSSTDSLSLRLFAGAANAPSGTKISEAIIIHNTLPEADRQKIEGYLAWKWGLEAKLPVGHPYKNSAPVGTDPDAAAYIARVEGVSGDNQALEASVKTAINDFVVGCKADGIWNAIKASCILAGARTLNGALQPLVGTAPTNFNFVSGDYSRATGLLGDGSTKYLDSNRDNTTDPQNSRHLVVYRTTSETRSATRVNIGNGQFNSGDSNLATTTTARAYRLSSSGSSTAADATTIPGLFGVSRPDGTTIVTRYNGVSTSLSNTSVAPTSGSILVFARGTSAVPLSPTNARQAFYSIGESIDLALLDARVTTLINAFSAL